MYVTTPLQITLANQNIPSANTQADVFKIENNAEQLQVIETFNPNNPYQVLDVTTLGIENFDKLGLTVQGNDTLLNIGNGKTVVLKNIDPNQLKASNFIGFKDFGDDEPKKIHIIEADGRDYIISDFAVAEHIIDVSSFSYVTTLNDISITQENNNTVLILKGSTQRIILENIDADLINLKHFVRIDSGAVKRQTNMCLPDNCIRTYDDVFSSTATSPYEAALRVLCWLFSIGICRKSC